MTNQSPRPASRVLPASSQVENPLEEDKAASQDDNPVHGKIRSLRLVEARLIAIKKLTIWLEYGWRMGGEDEMVGLYDAQSMINQKHYGGLLLLEKATELFSNDLRTVHEDLIAEDGRLALAASRQSFADFASKDAGTIIQGDVQATDEILDLRLVPIMRTLRMTITRAVAIKHLCKRLLDSDRVEFSGPSLDTKELLADNNKEMLSLAADRVSDCVIELLEANKGPIREHDIGAIFEGRASFQDVTTAAVLLTLDADDGVVHECGLWKVE